MINKILVLLDGDESAEATLNYAIEFASKMGSELIAACMTELGCNVNTDIASEAVGEKVELSRVTINGDPVKNANTCIKERNVDLVIMMTRNIAEINEQTNTDMGIKMLQQTKTPIMFIRPDTNYKHAYGQIKRILVPLDRTEEAESLMEYVMQIAVALSADVLLLEVVTEESQAVVGLLAYDSYQEKRLETEKIISLGYLGKIADRLRKQYENIEVICETKIGSPAAEIINYANEMSADVIVMSTRAHTGLRRLVFGSTATDVIRYSNTNLLLLKR